MTKGKILQNIWDEIPPERRNAIEARAAEKIKSYRDLQALRSAVGLTQAEVSEALNIPQGNVSRLEKNSDMLLSTLQKYIEAVGGKLKLTVELPNQPPIALTGFSELIEPDSTQSDTAS
ncbi:MAG: XRE family transcriptional regulator [Cyanobacteria bacterium P01_G01_bin.19]